MRSRGCGWECSPKCGWFFGFRKRAESGHFLVTPGGWVRAQNQPLASGIPLLGLNQRTGREV